MGKTSTTKSASSAASGTTGAVVRPFGWRDKIGYMCGDFGTDFMFVFAGTWFMIFYTKVMGVPGTIVGTLFLLARVLDAVMDVTVGVVVDRSKDHPGGKFRVTMMRFTAPLVILSFLMYQTFAIDAAMWVKIVYMSITYVVWCFFYSCVNIPFGSLASTISAEADDRTSLSTMRSMGGTIGGLILGIVAPIVIYQKVNGHQVIRGGDGTHIFAIVAAVVSIAAFIGYLICYFNVTERVHPDPDQNVKEGDKRSPLAMITNAFSSRSMLGIVAAALCLLVAQLFSNQLMTYVYTDVFGSAALASISGLLGTVVMFLVVPFVKPLTKRFGRKTICTFASALGAISMLLLFVVQTRNGMVFLLGASRPKAFLFVVFPSALPSIMNGIRLAVGFAWTTVVAAELNNGIPGIGALAYLSGTELNTPLTITCIFVIGIAALLLDWLILGITHLVTPWVGKE